MWNINNHEKKPNKSTYILAWYQYVCNKKFVTQICCKVKWHADVNMLLIQKIKKTTTKTQQHVFKYVVHVLLHAV